MVALFLLGGCFRFVKGSALLLPGCLMRGVLLCATAVLLSGEDGISSSQSELSESELLLLSELSELSELSSTCSTSAARLRVLPEDALP